MIDVSPAPPSSSYARTLSPSGAVFQPPDQAAPSQAVKTATRVSVVWAITSDEIVTSPSMPLVKPYQTEDVSLCS